MGSLPLGEKDRMRGDFVKQSTGFSVMRSPDTGSAPSRKEEFLAGEGFGEGEAGRKTPLTRSFLLHPLLEPIRF